MLKILLEKIQSLDLRFGQFSNRFHVGFSIRSQRKRGGPKQLGRIDSEQQKFLGGFAWAKIAGFYRLIDLDQFLARKHLFNLERCGSIHVRTPIGFQSTDRNRIHRHDFLPKRL